MKAINETWKQNFQTICAATLLTTALTAIAATKTWDGGGDPDFNWSAGANWDANTAPAATGDSLVFSGTTGLNNTNDNYVTSLGSSSIRFESGAGAFVLSGANQVTVGNGSGNDNFITNASASNQTIAFPIKLAGGGRDRTIILNTGTTLTLGGNVDFSNDWLFLTTPTAGTLVLSGNNTGDGKGSVLVAGTSSSRAMMRNNVAGTQLVLGSDTALGNSGSGDVGAGTANFRGLVANQNLSISTTGGSRNLSGSTIIINAANVTFNGTDNLTIGNLINQGGNRDFWVTSSGTVTVQNSLSLSADQTGRSLYVNLTGAGGMVVNGKIYDTFHSGGLTSGQGTFRKAGTGTMTLNGDSSYTNLTTIEGGTLVIGNANALGATGTSSGTTISGGSSTLDLNGFTIGESLTFNNSGNTLANSSGSAAAVTADATLNGDVTVNATGDITTARLIAGVQRTITKTGAGTLTTAGTNHNNLTAWQINQGTVVFANTSGYGADRGVTNNGGTLKLSGSNFDLINNSSAFVINTGVFDLNGKNEAVAAVGGSGGSIRNDASSTTSTLYVGGGPSGSSSASYGGVIENGAGTLKLTKEGSGTQTLTGANTYTGNTTISVGTLELAQSFATLATNSTVSISNGAALYLTVAGVTNIVTGLVTNGVAAGNGLYNSANSSGFITGSGYLQVGLVLGPSVPASITNSISGNTLTLSWPAGQNWRLESQTNNLSAGLSPAGWSTVSGVSDGSATITVDPANPTVFYRLAYP